MSRRWALLGLSAAVVITTWLAPAVGRVRGISPTQSVGRPWEGPSSAHPLGLDALGRDVLARLLAGGAGITAGCLLIGIATALAGAMLALTTWRRPRVAALVRHVTGIALAVPGVILVLLLSVFIGLWPAVIVAMLVLGVPASARMVTAALSAQARSGHVDAAVTRGERPSAVLLRDVLPAISATVLTDLGNRTVAALQLVVAIQVIRGGDQVTWSSMVISNLSGVSINPWAVAAPALALALVGAAIALGVDRVSELVAPPVHRGLASRRRPTELDDHDGVTVRDGNGAIILSTGPLRIATGDLLVVRGPSGSGKTTLLEVLTGRVAPGLVVTGAVGSDELASSSAFVPQDPASTLDPRQRVERVLRDGRSRRAVPAEEIGRVIASLDLPDRILSQRAGRVSGGEAVRVAIARALLGDPELLVLDEPTAGLGAHARDRVAAVLRERGERGLTTVIVTHDDTLTAALPARLLSLAAVDGELSLGGHEGENERLLDVGGLGLDTTDGRAILRDASLGVDSGDVVSIVGPSGCGKSTLLRAIAGLHPLRAGRIDLTAEGRTTRLPTARSTDHPARRSPVQWRAAQLAGQDGRLELNPVMRLVTQVARPLRTLHGVPRREALRRADELLARLGVDAAARRRRPGECSGGQRQRAVLARAVIAEPAVLVADEPTSALDRASIAAMLAVLTEYRRRGGAVLIATHDEELAALADRVYAIDDGRLRLRAPAPEAEARTP